MDVIDQACTKQTRSIAVCCGYLIFHMHHIGSYCYIIEVCCNCHSQHSHYHYRSDQKIDYFGCFDSCCSFYCNFGSDSFGSNYCNTPQLEDSSELDQSYIDFAEKMYFHYSFLALYLVVAVAGYNYRDNYNYSYSCMSLPKFSYLSIDILKNTNMIIENCLINNSFVVTDAFTFLNQSFCPALCQIPPLSNQSYYSSLEKESMLHPQSRIAKIRAFLSRPYTTHTNSPLKIRQNNFMLDCINREGSALPIYHPENDAFIKPYISILMEKVKSQNTESTPNLTIKQDFKIRKSPQKLIGAQQFKNFLNNQRKITISKMKGTHNDNPSSYQNSPEKENMRREKRVQNQKEKFLSIKFSSYKIRSKKGMVSVKSKNVNSCYQCQS